MYKCNTEITSAEVFDPTKWDQVSVATQLHNIDNTLTIQGDAADSKAVGDAVEELRNAFNDSLRQSVIGATITKGAAINKDTGIITSASTWARSGLWSGHPIRCAINLPDTNYIFRIHFYNEDGDIRTGTGYLGYSGETKSGLQVIPKTYNGSPVAKICIGFRRADLQTMTDADVTTIQEKVMTCSFTDTTLAEAEIPADAKTTGEKIAELQSDITTVTTTINSSINSSDKYNTNQSLICESYTVPKFIPGTVSASTGLVTTSTNWRYNSSMYLLLTVNSTIYFDEINWRYRLFYYDKYGTYLGSPSVIRKGFTNIKYEATKAYTNAALFKVLIAAWDENTDQIDTSAPQLSNEEAQAIANNISFQTILTAQEEADKYNNILLEADNTIMVQGFWQEKAISNITIQNADPKNYITVAKPIFSDSKSCVRIEGLSQSDVWACNIYTDGSLSSIYSSGWITDNELTINYAGWIIIQIKHDDNTPYDLSSFTGKIHVEDLRYSFWSDYPLIGTKRLGYNNIPMWTKSRNAVQGIAIYNGVVFQALGNSSIHGQIQTYDLNTGEEIALFSADTGHGNTINFGKKKYDPTDEFPLLYCASAIGTDVSVENLATRVVNVLRVTRDSAQTIKTYQLPDPSEIGYHAQASIDEINDVLIISAYKYFGHWREYTDGDEIIISITKPIHTANYNSETGRYETEKAKSFSIPWRGYLQEGKVYGSYYWLLFSKPDTDDTTIYVIDYVGGVLKTTLSAWINKILNEEAEGIDFVENSYGGSEMIVSVGDHGTLRMYRIPFNE